MVSLDEVCNRLNQRLKDWKTTDVYVPVYRKKWKLKAINLLRKIFKKLGRANFYNNASLVDYWKFVRPDDWIKLGDNPKVIPESCEEEGLLWCLPYRDECWDYDLSYGIKPSKIFDDLRGGAPNFYASKVDGKIYALPWFCFRFNVDDFSLSKDYQNYLDGKDYEMDWEEREYL